MAYICNDCGNRDTRKFPGGRCPGCDSFNIRSTHGGMQDIKEREPRTMFELSILALLWGLLAYGAWDHFLRKPEGKTAASAAKPLAAPSKLEGKLTGPQPGMEDY